MDYYRSSISIKNSTKIVASHNIQMEKSLNIEQVETHAKVEVPLEHVVLKLKEYAYFDLMEKIKKEQINFKN